MASKSSSAGDAERGRRLFKQHCAACHSVRANGKYRSGPNLHAIMGRTAGEVAGYTYTDANKNKGITWTRETMSLFLANPRQYMPGNKMFFAGLVKEADRTDIIAFLESTSNN